MSKKGVFGAAVLAAAFGLFVAAAVAFDVWLHARFGDAGTVTFGVRWLTFHCPWVVMVAVGFVCYLLGFLTAHLWGSPKLFEDPPPEE